MEEKNQLVINYINNIRDSFEKNGHSISNDTIKKVTERYTNSELSFEQIKEEIDRLVEVKLEEIRRMQEAQREFMKRVAEMRDLQDLPLQYTGITLNNQDVDLMMIAGANTPQELQEALSKITNITVSLNTLELTDEQFVTVRQQAYNMYLDSLTSRNDYIKNRGIELSRKIQYLKSSGKITDEESNVLDNIISSSNGVEQIIERLNQQFSPEKVHLMYEIIRDFSPIEKTGIKSSTLEASRNLLEQIRNNYNSITIDEESKYGKIVLQDGTFDFRHLQKTLDFAQSLGKQVRLNTLLFYMDCPESLYNLEKTEENKILVKQKLQSYVDATTRFVMENGYAETVRSVDVFNELLNRHPMSGETPYSYRGDILQDPSLYHDFDNVKSGWLKHLSIEDLCDVISVARKNMPTTDFMYNDDHLTDPRKIPASIQLINKIKEYELKHGIKLIDSIGTQMHIDNDITKEQIKQMIINLSQFGLPIEITEFDIAMTNQVDGLSSEQIEQLRQQKINEIYECVEELREQCNIRGFTIWSKTDKQNFRVFLENEERIKKGLEPIESLHGGAFTETMESKVKKLVKQNKVQEFNYHTHTNRCGHAGIFSDREYVECAKRNGIKQLGFSDHVPVPELEYQDDEQRMHISDVEEYIQSIRTLQKENPDMKILCGFEAEFDPMKEQFLGELREKVDYIILGQHFVSNGIHKAPQTNNPNYPIEYANMLCKAMESGIFDIVAHPDTFMQFRDSLESEEAKRLFDQNAMIASQAICDKAKEIGIPIELNFAGIDKNQVMKDGEFSYPHSIFWKIAEETGTQVLYGVDAHNPSQFDTMDYKKEVIDKIANTSKLNFVPQNYNPVVARQNNKKLQELYEKGQVKSLTYETHLIDTLMGGILSNVTNEMEISMVAYGVEQTLDGISQNFSREATEKDQKTVSKIDGITQDTTLSTQEKSFALNRAKKSLEHTNTTLSQRQSAIDRAKESVHTAIEVGCQTKNELKTTVVELTEAKTTKKEEVKATMENNVMRTQAINNGMSVDPQVKGPTLVKKNNTSNVNGQSSNNGFINAVTLALIVAFVCGIGVGIGYMLYKIGLGG